MIIFTVRYFSFQRLQVGLVFGHFFNESNFVLLKNLLCHRVSLRAFCVIANEDKFLRKQSGKRPVLRATGTPITVVFVPQKFIATYHTRRLLMNAPRETELYI